MFRFERQQVPDDQTEEKIPPTSASQQEMVLSGTHRKPLHYEQLPHFLEGNKCHNSGKDMKGRQAVRKSILEPDPRSKNVKPTLISTSKRFQGLQGEESQEANLPARSDEDGPEEESTQGAKKKLQGSNSRQEGEEEKKDVMGNARTLKKVGMNLGTS